MKSESTSDSMLLNGIVDAVSTIAVEGSTELKRPQMNALQSSTMVYVVRRDGRTFS